MTVNRVFYYSDDLGTGTSYSTDERRWPVPEEDANLLSSEVASQDPLLPERGSVDPLWLGSEEMHAPALDVDLPVRVRESETPGHYHLFIDKVMPWTDYAKLLNVLADVGIIERGYADASLAQGATFVATRPWKTRTL